MSLTTGDLTRPPRLCTLEELQERLRYWQDVLRLTDWDIEIRLVRQSALSDRDNAGELHQYPSKKRAVILVLDAPDYPDSGLLLNVAQDMEYTVVHELVHLAWSWLPQSKDSMIPEEQSVHTIARALIALDRARAEAVNRLMGGVQPWFASA